MKTLSFLFAFTLLSVSAMANPGDPTFTKIMPAFEEIEIDLPANVQIVMDGTNKVEVTTSEMVYSFLNFSVAEGRLYVDMDKLPAGLSADGGVDIVIHVASLSGVKAKAGSTITSADTFKAKNFWIHTYGDSSVELAIDAEKVRTFIRGNGSVKLSGTAQVAKVKNSGGTYVDDNLTASTASPRSDRL